ncbi:MAG: DUF1566 domain-containing protein [Deltaproteobacteria bacterium]|nr:MAG: DUF1566 domain-containing protein [Deltaproteobacteria bacterium]
MTKRIDGKRVQRVLVVATVAALAACGPAWALDAATKCRAGKLTDAGKYCQCRLKADAKAAKKAALPDYGKCDAVFSKKWQAKESKAAGSCPSNGDEAEVRARTTEHTDALASLLAGASALRCQHLPASGQTVSYGPGDDGDLQMGEPFAFIDNGDGTITDVNTRLMWEKKIAFDGVPVDCIDEMGTCANPHDADNLYSWSSGGTDFSGSLVAVFLEQLNNRCDKDPRVVCATDDDCSGTDGPGGACGFAGYRDWRVPSIRELLTITDFGRLDPSVPPAFHGVGCGPSCTDMGDPACACTADEYWSSTTDPADPGGAYAARHRRGNGGLDIKIKTKDKDSQRAGGFAVREGGRTIGAGSTQDIIK